jgi:hypothetical protein
MSGRQFAHRARVALATFGLTIGALACAQPGSDSEGDTPGGGMSAPGGGGSGAVDAPGVAGSGVGGPSSSGGAGSSSVPGAAGGGAGALPLAGNGSSAGSGAVAEAGNGGGSAGAGGASSVSVDEGNASAVIDPVGNANRAPGFVDLSPRLGAPLPVQGDAETPAPPAGWSWHAIEGAICRDGSPTGFYVHRGTGDGLVIFLEGGGACSNVNYCAFNPANVDQVLAGDGEIVLGSALGAGPGRQQPGAYTDATHVGAPAGIFDTSNAANPFRDWSQVYVPYCTGDVHFGTKKGGTVPGFADPQQFVGYYNMQKFVSRIVPTFKDQVSKVVITGSSAGGFGAALNFSMVQDAFGDTPVLAISDSGPPFDDQYMPVCMQKRWRDAWSLTDAMPPDCTECRQADGGGMLKLSDFLLRKHPTARIAMISAMEDEVIRLFFSVGLGDCAPYDTADPVAVVLLQGDPAVYFPAEQYTAGLNALRATYMPTGRLSTYYMAGDNVTFHQHLFRNRFYEAPAGGVTIAKFVGDFVNGTNQAIGP